MIIWKLNKGADRRIRTGHPWIFSNELSHSPKGVEPGSFVELQDAKGDFLARGYGNPHSLIAFRALSFDPDVRNPLSFDYLIDVMTSAWRYRKSLGYKNSFRLCYGEGDFLPGVVIDLYRINGGQVLAVQLVTAGLNKALQPLEQYFEQLISKAVQDGLTDFGWDQTAVVIRNDVNIRKLEGLEVETPRIIKQIHGLNLNEVQIWIDPVEGVEPVKMWVDLVEGQKTGFFLDQAYNIRLFAQALKRSWIEGAPKEIKILDLCCYVGQWSTQLSRLAKEMGVKARITQVDISKEALKFSEKNAQAEAADVETKLLDVVQELGALVEKYDIVIADPPAFIKNKKDIHTGSHAYLKINTHAFRLAKPNSWVISCSCSGLFTEELFIDVLSKSIRRNQIGARLALHGGHSPDHPILMNFPEGFYLKMFVHKT